MENQNNQQPTPQAPQMPIDPMVPQPIVATPPIPETPKPKGKITNLIKDIYINVKNKKIFKLIMILFGIIVSIIILGSIYSLIRNTDNKQPILPSPTPAPTPQIILTDESKKSQSILEELRNKILNLDINQKHLTPPSIDFDISF